MPLCTTWTVLGWDFFNNLELFHKGQRIGVWEKYYSNEFQYFSSNQHEETYEIQAISLTSRKKIDRDAQYSHFVNKNSSLGCNHNKV